MGHTTSITDPSVRAFLKDGSRNGSSDTELASAINAEMLRLVQHSLSDALSASRRLVRRSRSAAPPIKLAAQRALGRAALMSASYKEAEAAYREARDLARNDRITRGRIDRTLIDVYMYLGNFSESKRRASMALKTFESLDKPSEIAKTNVNYANVLHRQDRHRDAEQLYRKAADHFSAIGDELATARCHYNRANTLVQLFEFEEAARLYRRSRDIYARHNCRLDAVDADWGLSWLHMLEGKFHVALQELSDCEEAYRQINVPLRVASCELDRAEVYLNLNLFTDALTAVAWSEEGQNDQVYLKASKDDGENWLKERKITTSSKDSINPGIEVDGMDVLAVHSVAQEAVARARAGEGPTLIEALTYRFRGHSLADPDELRSSEEKDYWMTRDPIKTLATYLQEQNLADAEELKAIDQRIQEVINDAVQFAQTSPEPDPSELHRYIFAED